MVAKGVFYFRPEFVLRLQALARELQLPILADEVATGGGRTGKFFAYEHYPDFQPNYGAFGKGLQVAGIASVGRGPVSVARVTTLKASSEALYKATQTLKRIRESHLMENAVNAGNLIQKVLREKFVRAKYKPGLAKLSGGQLPADQTTLAKLKKKIKDEIKDLDAHPEKLAREVRGLGLAIYANFPEYAESLYRIQPHLTLTPEQIQETYGPKLTY